MKEELRVPVSDLRRVCDPKTLRLGRPPQPTIGFIGQQRAIEALNFGLEIDAPQYHIAVIAGSDTGARSDLLSYLNDFAKSKAAAKVPLLRDICYVYNFSQPDQSKLLILEKGKGKKFKERIGVLLKDLRVEVPALFRLRTYSAARGEIFRKLHNKTQNLLDESKAKIRKNKMILVDGREGAAVGIASLKVASQKKPTVMGMDEYDSLPEKEQKKLFSTLTRMTLMVNETSKKIKDLEEEADNEVKKLDESSICNFLDVIFGEILREYAGDEKIVGYLNSLKDYVKNNAGIFDQPESGSPQMFGPASASPKTDNAFLPFTVNLVTDNGPRDSLPVIFEKNPTFENLFGKIEKKWAQGFYLTTDFSHIKGGSLLSADGGYLILNVMDILRNANVWEKLVKTIKHGSLEIEEPMRYLGFTSDSLDPEAIPIKTKVILVGSPFLFSILESDPDFSTVFKARVEFDDEMPLTRENESAYADFIASHYAQERLTKGNSALLFDGSAMARIIEEGSRLPAKQTKLSTEFDKIKELLVQAEYWARKSGAMEVTAAHVEKALETERIRVGLTESRIKDYFKEEILLLDTKGTQVGQVNGLSVVSTNLGDHLFGMPSRITVQTFLGGKGVISIDREVKMSGPIHDKGVQIFSGYFGAKYGRDAKISFSASICFEQSYGGVEGDSASAAELFGLISSLSELPIKQSLAVTGSVNQFGVIQPIGGVNEKIEGFFDICNQGGLTGFQGVIIPHQNVRNLMLRQDVVDACNRGKFSIYAIKDVDDGLELLMGQPAQTIHNKVKERLSDMASKIKEFNKDSDK